MHRRRSTSWRCRPLQEDIDGELPDADQRRRRLSRWAAGPSRPAHRRGAHRRRGRDRQHGRGRRNDRRHGSPDPAGHHRHARPYARAGLHPQGGLPHRLEGGRCRRRDDHDRHAERRAADGHRGDLPGEAGAGGRQLDHRLRALGCRHEAGGDRQARRCGRDRLQDLPGLRRLPARPATGDERRGVAAEGVSGHREDRVAAQRAPVQPEPVRGAVGGGLRCRQARELVHLRRGLHDRCHLAHGGQYPDQPPGAYRRSPQPRPHALGGVAAPDPRREGEGPAGHSLGRSEVLPPHPRRPHAAQGPRLPRWLHHRGRRSHGGDLEEPERRHHRQHRRRSRSAHPRGARADGGRRLAFGHGLAAVRLAVHHHPDRCEQRQDLAAPRRRAAVGGPGPHARHLPQEGRLGSRLRCGPRAGRHRP